MQQLQRQDTLSTLVSTANIATQQQSQQLAKAQHTLVKVFVQPVVNAQTVLVPKVLVQINALVTHPHTYAQAYVQFVATAQMLHAPNLLAQQSVKDTINKGEILQ